MSQNIYLGSFFHQGRFKNNTKAPRRVYTSRHCGACSLAGDVWWTLKSFSSGCGLEFAPRQHRLFSVCGGFASLCVSCLPKCLVSKSEQIYTHAQASRDFDAALPPPPPLGGCFGRVSVLLSGILCSCDAQSSGCRDETVGLFLLLYL